MIAIARPNLWLPERREFRIPSLRDLIAWTTGKGQYSNSSGREKYGTDGRTKYDGGSGCTGCGCGGACASCSRDLDFSTAVATFSGIMNCGGTTLASVNGSYGFNALLTPCSMWSNIGGEVPIFTVDPTYGLILQLVNSAASESYFCGRLAVSYPIDCSSGTYTFTNLITGCPTTLPSYCFPPVGGLAPVYGGTATITL